MDSLLETIRRIGFRSKRPCAVKPPDGPVRELHEGEIWGQFRILRPLGKGAFGLVYQARDRLERDVALKLLDNAEAVREGRILAQLQHANVVGIYGCEQFEGRAALSMEMVEGLSMEQFVSEYGAVDPPYAALVGRQLCGALAAVHSKGLVHRDIKASNVMRHKSGRIVLVDFGLGVRMSPEDTSYEVAGTLPYLAPEVFAGKPASVAADLYAAGVLLYYLVSRQYPLLETSYAGYESAHREGRRTHLIDVRPDLPADFVAIVDKALEPDHTRRFRSAGAMARALDGVLQTHARPRMARKWLALPAALLLGGVAAWWWRHPPAAGPGPQLRFTRLTLEDALSRDPSLSRDGALVVYSSDQGEEGNLDIWIRQVPNGAALRVTKTPGDDSSPAFSPDGHSIAFRSERGGGGVYLVPAFGGEPKLIAEGGYGPRFSPDGKYLAYWTGEFGHPRFPSAQLYLMPAAGGTPRRLCSRLPDARHPVWAPDSIHILFQSSNDPEAPPDEDPHWSMTTVDDQPAVDTGALESFRRQGLEVHTDSVFWSGEYLLFAAARKENVNLWRAHTLGAALGRFAAPQRLTVGAAFETSPWTAANGNVVFASQRDNLRIWAVDLKSHGAPLKLTNTAEFDAFPSVARDGRWMAFTRTSSEVGIRQIWVHDLVTGVETALTDTAQPKSNAAISPDGMQIAFNVRESHSDSIYLVNRNKDIHKLCGQCGVVTAWTPDGAALLSSTGSEIRTVDAHSGTTASLLRRAGYRVEEAAPSADGQWIAFSAHQPGGTRNLFLAPKSNPSDWRALSEGPGWSEKPHWASDQRALYFYSNRDGYPCLWVQPLSVSTAKRSGPAQPAHHFHNTRLSPIHISQPVRGFAVSGTRAFFNLAEEAASVWMGEEEK